MRRAQLSCVRYKTEKPRALDWPVHIRGRFRAKGVRAPSRFGDWRVPALQHRIRKRRPDKAPASWAGIMVRRSVVVRLAVCQAGLWRQLPPDCVRPDLTSQRTEFVSLIS